MAERGGIEISYDFFPPLKVVAEGWFMTAARLSDMVGVVEDMTSDLSEELARNFEVGGRPGWTTLKDTTIERKEKEPNLRGAPEDILVRSGALWDEIADPNNWDVQREGAGAVGSYRGGVIQDEYGHWHLTGTPHMPIRDYLELPDDIVDGIADTFDAWVGEQIV